MKLLGLSFFPLIFLFVTFLCSLSFWYCFSLSITLFISSSVHLFSSFLSFSISLFVKLYSSATVDLYLQEMSIESHAKSKRTHLENVCVATPSAVGIETGYGLDGRVVGVPSPARYKVFLFSVSSRPVLGPTQLPIQWAPGALAPGVKRPGRETDHSLPTIAGGQEYVDLHIHSPIHLHGLVLN
jgi:hypothetical protein